MTTPKRQGGKKAMRAEANVLRAFSVDHAADVTEISKLRLTRWDRLGLFSPEYIAEEDRGNPYARVYSYTDLVGLRTVALLVGKYRVPIAEIQRAYDELIKQWDKPWSQIKLGVLKRRIVTDLDGLPRNVTDGQYALKHIPLPAIADEIRERAEALRHRRQEQIGQLERQKFIAHNALVLAGTRIPASAIREFIDEGFSDRAIVKEYPTLTARDIQAVRRLAGIAA